MRAWIIRVLDSRSGKATTQICRAQMADLLDHEQNATGCFLHDSQKSCCRYAWMEEAPGMNSWQPWQTAGRTRRSGASQLSMLCSFVCKMSLTILQLARLEPSPVGQSLAEHLLSIVWSIPITHAIYLPSYHREG